MSRGRKTVLLCSSVLACVALAALGQGPLPFASAQPASKASSAARVATPPPRTPAPVSLASVTLPSSRSDRPTLEEWKTATAIEPTRRSPAARRCRASLVREWLKVHCDERMAGVRQFAGSTDGVLLWVTPIDADGVLPRSGGGEIIVPLREGDRRTFQFFSLTGGEYEGIFPEQYVVLEEVWLEGEARPTVILR